jgi:hypothetical protein
MNKKFHVPPRLIRPKREDFSGSRQLLIVAPPARQESRFSPRARFITLYVVLMIFSLYAFFTRPQPVDAEPPPAELRVGEQIFTEAEPQESSLALVPPGEMRMAKISHYWPPLGGPNCAVFRNGQCISNMASGLPWHTWVGRAAACPAELPFWTVITLPGGESFVCLDRGGKIVTTDAGEIWIDLLVERAPVPFGTLMPVTVHLPYWNAEQ